MLAPLNIGGVGLKFEMIATPEPRLGHLDISENTKH